MIICYGVINVEENNKRLRCQGSHELVVPSLSCDLGGSFNIDVCSVSSFSQNMDVVTTDMDSILASLMDDEDDLDSSEDPRPTLYGKTLCYLLLQKNIYHFPCCPQ